MRLLKLQTWFVKFCNAFLRAVYKNNPKIKPNINKCKHEFFPEILAVIGFEKIFLKAWVFPEIEGVEKYFIYI
ncbi:MAG: hypothetical protein K6C94_07420 [Candidatus Gastranaerophilales bacterium]|nr:hypothetical protein [Candidatus Gastranaerophilales bacterium]